MVNPDDVLQYGALGLLFAVLVAGGVAVKSVFERMFRQIDEYFQFVREQTEKINTAQAGQLTAWMDAHKEQIKTSATIAEALGRLQENMGEMLKILRRLNGNK